MGYQIRKIPLAEAKTAAFQYEYALLTLMSEPPILRPVRELSTIKWEECLEARFFSDQGELHIFDVDGQMRAVQVTDDGTEDIFIQKYQLARRYSQLGKTLLVQEYLEADEDGQMQVRLTRLKGIA